MYSWLVPLIIDFYVGLGFRVEGTGGLQELASGDQGDT